MAYICIGNWASRTSCTCDVQVLCQDTSGSVAAPGLQWAENNTRIKRDRIIPESTGLLLSRRRRLDARRTVPTNTATRAVDWSLQTVGRHKHSHQWRRVDRSLRAGDFWFLWEPRCSCVDLAHADVGLTVRSDVGVPEESSEKLTQAGQPLHRVSRGALDKHKPIRNMKKISLSLVFLFEPGPTLNRLYFSPWSLSVDKKNV